jgi:hypothetical protein
VPWSGESDSGATTDFLNQRGSGRQLGRGGLQRYRAATAGETALADGDGAPQTGARFLVAQAKFRLASEGTPHLASSEAAEQRGEALP